MKKFEIKVTGSSTFEASRDSHIPEMKFKCKADMSANMILKIEASSSEFATAYARKQFYNRLNIAAKSVQILSEESA